MCLKPEAIDVVPEETARIAHAAYPKGNIYLQLRDEFGAIYKDEQFAELYPRRGQPAQAPWRLALVSVMQFREGLSDRQAADAVRGRLDWKYLLGLELGDSGFDQSVLVEFRQRLLTSKNELLIFDLFLTQLRERGYLKMRGQQRTDSTHVLAKIRSLNRVEGVGETFRAALNSLAVVAPSWLKEQWQEAWIERYEHRVQDYRLPDGKQARDAYALLIGQDGAKLLDALYAETAPGWLREIPAVQTLRRVWVQNFYWEEGDLHWRDLSNAPAAGALINAPYDPEALFAQKRETQWVGYKVHLTETCDDDSPHLITHIETTPAPQADDEALPRIHEALATRDLLPQKHIVDTGYVDAQELVQSRQNHDVDLFGSTREDYHWQARENSGFAVSQFDIDWQQECATCPAGKISSSWTPVQDRRGNVPTHSQLHLVEFLRCVCSNRIWLYKPYANDKPPRSSKRHTIDVPGLRAPFLKVFVLSSYDEHAIWVSQKFICSRSLRPRPSTSAAFPPGTLSTSLPKHGRLLLSDWSKKLPKGMGF